MSPQAPHAPGTPGRALALAGQVLWLGALVGTLVGLGLAALRLAAYDGATDLVRARVLATSVTRSFATVLAALLVWLVLRAVLARAPRPALLATATLWLPASLALGRWLNLEHLPGFLELTSVGVNLALGIGLFVVLVAGSRGLESWRARALGGPPPRLALAWLLAPAAALVVDAADARRTQPGPDVIVILIDVLRADHLSCYGYERETTPAIDRLAADGVLFEQAVSQGTFTKTSVASLFTGVYPYRHRVYHGGPHHRGPNGEVTTDVLSPRFTTMAESLAAADYLTVAWVENPQLRAYMGFDQGFTRYHDQPGDIETIERQFLAWVREWGPRRSVFAYLHVLDLHGPYLPRPPFDTRFGRYSDTFDGMTWQSWRKFRKGVEGGRIQATPEEIAQLESLYDGQLAYIDREVGKILDELKALGLYEDALIVVVADHGEAFLEHGFVAHTNVPYEELVRVPLIVKLPGSRHAGLRIADQVPLVDLLPTIEELVGTPVSSATSEREGRSLLPLMLRGEVGEPRYVYTETAREVALRTGKWKYIHSLDADPELYDLVLDPGEVRNVLAENPALAEVLGELATTALLERKREQAERLVVDPETAARLEELGYL